MNTSVLVTLADKNYIDQAKQLFSSAYWNAGWKGDYLLLAHEIPEGDLAWFREKGILIRHCKRVGDGAPVAVNESRLDTLLLPQQKKHFLRFRELPVVLDKFYLFTAEFKKWDNVVFLDSDIIARYSLGELAKVSGFWAVPDSGHVLLKDQFVYDPMAKDPFSERLKRGFDLDAPAFNSGVMAFSTDIIREDSFERLSDFLSSYFDGCTYGEQPILNLFFYKKWKPLNFLYNIYAPFSMERYQIQITKIDGIVIHILGPLKPWSTRSPFYREWKANVDRADLIDLKNKSDGGREFSKIRRIRYSLVFYGRRLKLSFIQDVDRTIGRIGLFLKKRSPWLYTKLKGTPS